MAKVSIKGIDETMRELNAALEREVASKQAIVTKKLVESLKKHTPVDTGHARDSWRVAEDGSVKNDAPYIEELNHGSSKQAPAFFIEKAVLDVQEVRPKGSIVKHI